MSSSVFSLDKSPRALPAYIAVVLVLAALCFGSLMDHLLFTHDDEIFHDYPRLSADPSFFFAADKITASGRLVDELVMWAAYAAWGDNPALFHLLSVLCHVLASFCLALAYSKLGANRELSMVAGLLFLLNVTHIQAVHWISALEYPLAMLLAAAAAHSYGAYATARSPARLAAFYALVATGLLAHIATLMLWPFCLLWSLSRGRGLQRTLRELVPLALLLLPVLYLVAQMTPSRSSTWDAASSYAPDQALPLLAGIGRTLIWFTGRLLSTAHWLPLAPSARPGWEVVLGLIALAGLGMLIWRRTEVGVWAAWTLLFLVPFLVLPERLLRDLPVGPSRYLYLASAGSSLLLAWLVQKLGLWAVRWRRDVGRILYVGVVVGLVLASGFALKKAEALAFYMSARHYLASGDEEIGIAQMERAMARGPDIINMRDAHERLGLLRLLDPERFAGFLAPALAQFPESIPLNIFSLVFESVGPDSAGQREALAHLAAIGGDPDIATLIGRSYHNLGSGLYESGATERAVAAYRHSLQFLPDRVPTLGYLALALRRAGDLPASSDALLRAVQLAPRDPQVLYQAALGLQLRGESARAVEYCLAALDLQPSADLYLLLGACYQKLAQTAQARSAYHRSIALDPHQLLAYTHLANMLEPDQAIATLEQAIAAGISHAELYKRLGRLYFQRGERARAVELHHRAIALDPDNVQAHTNLGAILMAMGQLREAHSAYEQASALEPQNPAHYLKMGELSRSLGDPTSAIDAYRKALTLNPDDFPARTNLGWLLYGRGALDEAIGHYRYVLDRSPNSAAQFNLGLALLATGDAEAAHNAYAAGVVRYGAAEAERIGAVDDLRTLADPGAGTARDIIETYWP